MEERQYRVIETLGEGGFGTVFRAEMLSQGGFAKQVALKVMHTDRGLPEEVALRLRDEARMLGHVRHRAVVGVDGLAHLDEGWAVVMEYIDGVDAKDLLTHGPTPVRVALEIVEEAAGALHAAYYARPLGSDSPLRLVHRDIKPANIRITPAGEVKVLDFGVARADFGAREARTEAVMYGTLTYMAPERIEGDTGPEGDVFALGLVLLDLLLGEDRTEPPPPSRAKMDRFQETRFERLAAILDDREPEIGATERAALLALIRSTLLLDENRRPSARDVERQCRALRASLPGIWLRDWAEDNVPGLMSARRKATAEGRVLKVHSDSLAWDHDRTPRPAVDQTPTPAMAEPAPLEQQTPPLLVESLPPPSERPYTPPEPPPPRRRGAMIGVAVGVAIVAVGVLLLRPGGTPETPTRPPAVAPAQPSAHPATPTAVAPAAPTPPAAATPTPPIAPEDESKTARGATTARKATEKTAEKTPEKTPEKTAEKAVEKASEKPVASKTGHVTVSGDATRVSLVAGGNTLSPGDVPAGTYTVMATFEGGDPTAAGVVDVKAGETTKVYCSATFSRCGVR